MKSAIPITSNLFVYDKRSMAGLPECVGIGYLMFSVAQDLRIKIGQI